jgi:hypothetical protein
MSEFVQQLNNYASTILDSYLLNKYHKKNRRRFERIKQILMTKGVPEGMFSMYYGKYTWELKQAIAKATLCSIITKKSKKYNHFKHILDNLPVVFDNTPTVDEAMNTIRDVARIERKRDNLARTFRKTSVNPIKDNIKLLNRATLKPRSGLTGSSAKSRKTVELSRRSYHRGISFNPIPYTRLIPTKEENQRYTGHIPSSTRRVSKPLFSHYARKGKLPRVIESPPPRKKTAFNRFRNTARNSIFKVRDFLGL